MALVHKKTQEMKVLIIARPFVYMNKYSNFEPIDNTDDLVMMNYYE